MAAAVVVPLSEYLRTSYHPDCEWVDGVVRERHMGDRPHATLQRFFLKFFFAIEREYGLIAYAELRTQVSEKHYRVADVLVLRKSDPFALIVRVAPLLCIEILSPDDQISEMDEKIEDYLAMGVGAVWVVDPRRRTALVADRHGARPVATLELPGTEIRVTVAEIFAELDELERGA